MTSKERMLCFGGDVRCIAEWRFEDGSFVTVHVGGKLPTEEAMAWVEKLFAVKRQEIKDRIEPEAETAPSITDPAFQ